MEALDRLKDDLAISTDWNVTITVSKKDLEKLVATYETLRDEKDEKRNKRKRPPIMNCPIKVGHKNPIFMGCFLWSNIQSR